MFRPFDPAGRPFRFIPGSPFEGYHCWACREYSPPVYPPSSLCAGCALRSKCGKYKLALRPVLHREAHEIIKNITEYLVPDYAHACKLHFLREVLLTKTAFRWMHYLPCVEIEGAISLHVADYIIPYLNRNILLRDQNMVVD